MPEEKKTALFEKKTTQPVNNKKIGLGSRSDLGSKVSSGAKISSGVKTGQKIKPDQKTKPKKVKPVKKPKIYATPKLHWRLAIGGVLGVILISGLFYSSRRLVVQVEEMKQKRGQMVALSQKEESYQQLSSSLKLIEKEIPLIEKAFFNEAQMLSFLDQVDQIESESGIVLDTLSFANDVPRVNPEENSYYIEMVIKASGETEKLEKFVEKILALPVLIRVKVLDVAKLDEEVKEMVFKAWLYSDPDFWEE